MDGDTCGGLSPIAGIDKAFLRSWLRWIETQGPANLSAIPALSAVNVQAPTAELRPADANQTDEGDLMPYELLDAIEGSAIRDKHTPLEVFLEMRAAFPNYTTDNLEVWIDRFFRLWCRNQWKRERYAPSFHLDDKNLDPKTWCPIPNSVRRIPTRAWPKCAPTSRTTRADALHLQIPARPRSRSTVSCSVWTTTI